MEIGHSRDEAIRRNLHLYYGRPCLYGHGNIRKVNGRHCTACSRLSSDKWRGKNIPRVRAAERKRYEKNPQKFVEKSASFYSKNAERIKEKRMKRHFEDYENEEYRIRARAATRKWAINNPKRAWLNSKVSKHKRRQREKGADGSFTASDVSEILKSQNSLCALCRTRLSQRNRHVDHIISLSAGGSNRRSNIQVLCVDCNLAKGKRDPIDFSRSIGLLL